MTSYKWTTHNKEMVITVNWETLNYTLLIANKYTVEGTIELNHTQGYGDSPIDNCKTPYMAIRLEEKQAESIKNIFETETAPTLMVIFNKQFRKDIDEIKGNR